MKFKNLKKLLSFIGTTTLVTSPIIAMGGGLLNSNYQPLNNENKTEEKTRTITTAMGTYTEIMCDSWSSTDEGDSVLWTCNTSKGDIKLRVIKSLGRLDRVSIGLLKKDPDETGVTYYLDLSSITGVTYTYGTFSGCKSLSGCKLPEGITNLKSAVGTDGNISGTFSTCNRLIEVIIPNTVTSISSWSFDYCVSLPQITLPDGLTTFGGAGCFFNCRSLTQITIPNGVTSLPNQTFYWCKSLTQITIPSKINEIGSGCFYDCESLSRINFLTWNDSITIKHNSISTLTTTEVYFVNDSLYEKYSPADGTDGWGSGSGWTNETTITFAKYYYDNFSPLETSKIIDIKETTDNLSLGTFTVDNTNVVDTSAMTAKITGWNANKGTTSDEITLSVVKDDSDSSGLKYKVVATWNDSQFTAPNEVINFGIGVYDTNGSGVAGTNSNTTYNWTVNYENLTSITITADGGNSKVTNNWDSNTEVLLMAEPNSGANPDELNSASWSVSGQTSNGKISVSGTGKTATLIAAKDLSQGTYNVTIQCSANGVTGQLSYSITKNYIDLSTITVKAEDSSTSNTNNNWDSDTPIDFTADANANTDPNVLNNASWSVSGQTSNGKISVSGTGKTATLIAAKDLPQGTYNVTVKCTSGSISGNVSYQIIKNYADLIAITVRENDGNTSKTINEWESNTSIDFTADANANTDPNALNGASWSVSGDTSNGKITISGTGKTATLTVAKDLPQGTYNITVKCTSGSISDNLSYQIIKNYTNVTRIQISSTEGTSKTTKDWQSNTTIPFSATTNDGANPSDFDNADWQLGGNTGSGKITLIKNSSNGKEATLTAASNLPAGSYEVTVKCSVSGVTSNTVTFTINKQYIDYNKSNYEITDGINADAIDSEAGTASTALSVVAKSSPAGINPDVGRVTYSVKNVSCAEDPELMDDDIWVNNEKKLEWNPIVISTPTAIVDFTIIATLLDHNNDTIEVNGQINVSTRYASNVIIESNDSVISSANVIAGRESTISGILQISDVKDDTNTTNWNCDYEGRYVLSWGAGGQGNVSNYFELRNNSSIGNERAQDLVCKNTLPGGSYNLKIVYQFRTSSADDNFSGRSNAANFTINIAYDTPSSSDITISGQNTLTGTVAENGKSSEYKYNIANANKNDPSATISYRIEVEFNGNNYTGNNIELKELKSDKATIITWNNALVQGKYTIKLYTRYQLGTIDVESNAKTIYLTINYANVNGATIEGDKNLDVNSENKSCQFNIKPLSENGNINSIDPSYKDNSNYTWSINSTDEKTKEAINNGWISINESTGQLTWTADLDADYSYQVTIIAVHKAQSSLFAAFKTTISSKTYVNWTMIGGIGGGIILAIILLIIISSIIRKSRDKQPSEKYLTWFNRIKQ